MGVRRLLGREKHTYHATQLGTELTQSAAETDGVLLEVSLNPDNHGPGSMAAVYESMHQPATAPTYSVEIWFHGGEARFFLLAETEELADSLRRSVTNNYSDSLIEAVPPEEKGIPPISPEDYVAGATVVKSHPDENHSFLPIGYFDDGDGWNADQVPIGDIISQMQTGKESTVIVQATLEALPSSWTELPFPLSLVGDTAYDIKERYREQGRSDLKRMVEKQTSMSVFATNIRLLAISPNEAEARNRVAAVGSVFDSRFNSAACGMGLSSRPVDARTDWRQRPKMRAHVGRMMDRRVHAPTCTQLGHQELTAIHFPNEEAGAPSIRWKHARSGADAPVDRPEYADPTEIDLSGIDPDSLPSELQ